MAEREIGKIGNVEAINPAELAVVAEPEFQYGAEAFDKRNCKKALNDDGTYNWIVTTPNVF